jgi:hypothetical protein
MAHRDHLLDEVGLKAHKPSAKTPSKFGAKELSLQIQVVGGIFPRRNGSAFPFFEK